MDKDFVLKHLKAEHLKGCDALEEISEVSGMDVVVTLFRNHETLQVYIQNLTNIKPLMKDIIRQHKYKSIGWLADHTGLSRRLVRKHLKELDQEESKK